MSVDKLTVILFDNKIFRSYSHIPQSYPQQQVYAFANISKKLPFNYNSSNEYEINSALVDRLT